MFSSVDEPFGYESDYEQTALDNGPLVSKRALITTIVSVVVVVFVFLSIGLIGVFYGLDLFDVYAPEDKSFQGKVIVQNIMNHLGQFDSIAAQHSNSRAMDLGYNASVQYVVDQLKQYPDYFTISTQDFPVVQMFEVNPPQFSQITPQALQYKNGVDFQTISYSGSGDLTDSVIYVGTGCQATEYYAAGFSGGIALVVNTPDCRTVDRADLADQMEVKGLLIFNDDPGLFSSSAKTPRTYPIFALSHEAGTEIQQTIAIGQPVSTRMIAEMQEQTSITTNIIADTPGTNGMFIVSGSHLDSVPAGPGINDNGSGSAANLEIALQFAATGTNPVNPIRFAWWAAEELGLKGSRYYVSSLDAAQLSQIALNVNFDMIASPNFMRGIYNGSQADAPIRKQSTVIMGLFIKFFESLSLSFDLTDFTGRSDYGPFLEVGIPAGGLFSGAEELKTPEQREKYGGIANMAFDPCYHESCDTLDNINRDALEEMAQAAAYVVYTLAMQTNLYQFLHAG